jgi:NOL1/NOP2/fmu family ribosome biogenesis protein
MQKLKILNRKELKRILSLVEYNFGSKFPEDKAYLLSGKDRLYMVNKELSMIDDKEIRIDSIGLYIGTLSNGQFRPSIEGSQILKPKKSFIEVSKEQIEFWMAGKDLDVSKNLTGVKIVKYGEDYAGSGVAKEGKLLNHVPKERRINRS